ncbi:MAG: SAM-dependent methyltransferase, partial [Chloroflexi bacterium RBG_13_66_10]
MDILSYNRRAWDREVERMNPWTVPVGPEVIAAARRGEWQIVLTPTKPVPRHWFPDLAGLEVLCLASGGGQQGPVMAAAGAKVTVLDNSPRQLEGDRLVAEREGLEIATVQGDMADLSAFGDDVFGLVINPASTCFVPDVRAVWREAARVLRPGGALLAGFANPVNYLFDFDLAERGVLEVRHTIPYSDLTSRSEEERRAQMEQEGPLEFGHTLEHLIGGQLEEGLVITGLFDDVAPGDAISARIPTFIATRAVKGR